MRPLASALIAGALGVATVLNASCAASPATPLVTSPECKAISPRVPEPLAALDWVRTAQATERVFAGESVKRDPDARYDDPEAASIWITLREIDLNADGACDLVVTAIDSVGTAGIGPGHAVFWFAESSGWRRQGPDWGARSAGFNALARALLAPDSPSDFRVHGFGNYAPVKMPDGRTVLVVHVETGANASLSAPLLAYDAKARAVAPLAGDAATLAALAEKRCVGEQSEDAACLTW